MRIQQTQMNVLFVCFRSDDVYLNIFIDILTAIFVVVTVLRHTGRYFQFKFVLIVWVLWFLIHHQLILICLDRHYCTLLEGYRLVFFVPRLYFDLVSGPLRRTFLMTDSGLDSLLFIKRERTPFPSALSSSPFNRPFFLSHGCVPVVYWTLFRFLKSPTPPESVYVVTGGRCNSSKWKWDSRYR